MALPKTTLKLLLITVSLVSGIAMLFVKPIAQDKSFHQFADIRSIFSVANFWNVISNTVFFFFPAMSPYAGLCLAKGRCGCSVVMN